MPDSLKSVLAAISKQHRLTGAGRQIQAGVSSRQGLYLLIRRPRDITAGLESPNQGLIGTVPGCVRYLTALVPSDRGELNRRGSLKKQRPHCWKQ
jgi:hypothetical protein